jgi:hypothetical protein
VATKSDVGVYLPHYLTFDLNWVPFHGSFFEIAPGINLHHSPGYDTPQYEVAMSQTSTPRIYSHSSDFD